jgi:hypothetical protein
VAVETKYTALLAPGAMWLFAHLFRKHRLGLAALGVTLLVCGSWEFTMARLYGTSHFLYHCSSHGEALGKNPSPLLSLVTLLGGVAPALALLGLVALNGSRGVVGTVGSLIAGGYALLIHLGSASASPVRLHFPLLDVWTIPVRFTPDNLIFEMFGLLFCGVLAAIVWRLCLRTASGGRKPLGERTTEWFLALWLGMEIAGYFVLSPFPAVRRVMGISVVGTLLIGRLAAHTCRKQPRMLLARAVVVGGIGLGFAFYAVDLGEAFAQKQAAEEAAELLRGQHGTVWYVGHWGFQYYAQRAGMRPVVPGISQLRKGDWLVVPHKRLCQQAIQIPENALAWVHQLSIHDSLPVRTVAGYYGSRIPLETHAGARMTVAIYRVTTDFSVSH